MTLHVPREETDFERATKSRGWSEPAGQDQVDLPDNDPGDTERQTETVTENCLHARDTGNCLHARGAGLNSERLPAIEPQWATRVEQVPEGPGWVHEVELVGQRLLAYVEHGHVRLLDAGGEDWAERLPAVVGELAASGLADCVLDGLVCALGPDEQVFFAFDLLFVEGRDLRNVTLIERKRMLRDRLEGLGEHVRPCEYVLGAGAKVFNRACELGLEGVISKRADSIYEGHHHDRAWLVVKCAQRLNLIVGGFTAPHGSRRHLGALLVGSYDDEGRLVYRGKVGSGFCEDSLAELRPQLEQLQQDLPAFVDPPVGSQARGVSWVTPVLGVEVEYGELTDKGKLRHARFKGLRARTEPPRTEDMAMVRLTDPNELLFPELGLSKRDLADYLQQAAEKMLPHVCGRALSLVRWPGGPQRELTADGCELPEGVARHRTGDGADAQCLSVVDPLGLLGLVQMNMVEFRIRGARIDKSEHPDRLLFDLDPDEGVDFARVIEAALELRHRLAEFGLESFVKTSGGRGLHVVVPVQRRRVYAPVARFCRIVVERMVATAPDRYAVASKGPPTRGKVVIDHARNARQATIVAPYSVRAKPDALVSTPISWEELMGHGCSAVARPEEFTLPNVTRRLARLARDPWAEFFELRQWITKASFRKIGINPDLRSTQPLTAHP
jgi:bifunctional non-homologous end joining protein LigD